MPGTASTPRPAPAPRAGRGVLAHLLPIPIFLGIGVLLIVIGSRHDVQLHTLTGMKVIVEPRPGGNPQDRFFGGKVYKNESMLVGVPWYYLRERASSLELRFDDDRDGQADLVVNMNNWGVSVSRGGGDSERVEFSRERGVVIIPAAADLPLRVEPQDPLDVVTGLELGAEPTTPPIPPTGGPTPTSVVPATPLPPLPAGERRFIRIWTRQRTHLVIVLEREGAGRPAVNLGAGEAHQQAFRFGLPDIQMGNWGTVDLAYGRWFRLRVGNIFFKINEETTNFAEEHAGRAVVIHPDDTVTLEERAAYED